MRAKQLDYDRLSKLCQPRKEIKKESPVKVEKPKLT